jgi:hypothetical protein
MNVFKKKPDHATTNEDHYHLRPTRTTHHEISKTSNKRDSGTNWRRWAPLTLLKIRLKVLRHAEKAVRLESAVVRRPCDVPEQSRWSVMESRRIWGSTRGGGRQR